MEILRKEQPFLKENFGVKKTALFGSFAANKQTKKSDVDILVEFARSPGLKFVTLVDYLEKKPRRRADQTGANKIVF